MSAGEKTEKPTAKKRKESRKEGQVPRTQELGGWGAMLLAGLALPTLVTRELGSLRELMVTSLTAAGDADTGKATMLLVHAAGHAFGAVLFLAAGVLVVGVGSAVAQGGFYLATKAVKPSWSRVNPVKGFKRVFGAHALWEGAKMLLKSALVGLLVYAAIRAVMPLIGGLVPVKTVLDTVAGQAIGLIRNIAAAGVVLAAADYAMQRRRVGKQVRMTKEEVKQEHKQSEGDPILKSAIRSRQLAAARNRMMAAVPEADVVLVNPTHVAVALAYDAQRGAPRVVARGAGAIAARIRALAVTGRVPLVQDVPLARALYRSTEVGQEIPPELFAAVAQVLAFVISRRARGRAGGEHATPRRGDALPAVQRAAVRRRRVVRNPSAALSPGR